MCLINNIDNVRDHHNCQIFAKSSSNLCQISKTLMIKSLTESRSQDFCQIFDDFGFCFEKFGIGKKVSVSVSENLVSEKKSRFRFQNFWSRKKVSVLVSEKFGIGKKSRYRFRKIWYRKKSLGIGFGKFGIGKKVSVSVSENLVSEKKSRYRS